MRRPLRFVAWVAVAIVAVVVISAVVAVASVELACRPDAADAADTPAPIVEDAGYRRDIANTYLTFPEWYIVYSFEDFGEFLETNSESSFPYLSQIAGFWRSYCEANRVAETFTGDHLGYKVMINVIGLSYTFEYVIKGLYETTLGRLSEWIRGGTPNPEDDYARAVLQDYAAFLYQVPWYRYPFGETLSGLWTETPLVAGNPVRSVERKLSLSWEYLVKAGYAKVIAAGLAATSEPADLEIMFVVRGDPAPILARESDVRLVRTLPDDMALLIAPRYQAFTELAVRLSETDTEIVEIAGNRRILISVVAAEDGLPEIDAAQRLFALPIDARPGYSRFGLDVDVSRLSKVIAGYRQAGIDVEHLYDY